MSICLKLGSELEKRHQFVGQFVSKTFKKLHLDIGFSWVVSFRVDGRRGLLSPTLRTCPFDIWIGRYGITVGFDTECKSSIARCIFRYPIFCQVNSELEFRMLPPMKRYLIQQNLIKLYQKVIVDILRLLKVSVDLFTVLVLSSKVLKVLK